MSNRWLKKIVGGDPGGLRSHQMSLDGDLDFLTPSHLLTITSNILMPPAGNFQEIDGYDSVKDGNGFSTRLTSSGWSGEWNKFRTFLAILIQLFMLNQKGATLEDKKYRFILQQKNKKRTRRMILITIKAATINTIQKATLIGTELTFLERSLRKSCGSCVGDPRPLVRLRSQKVIPQLALLWCSSNDNNTGGRIELTFRNGTHIAVNLNNCST